MAQQVQMVRRPIVKLALAATALGVLIACGGSTRITYPPARSAIGSGAPASAAPATGHPSGPVISHSPGTPAPQASAPETLPPTGPPATPSGPDGSLPASPPQVTPGPVGSGSGLPIDWQQAPAAGLGVVLSLRDAAWANGRIVIIGDATEEFLPGIWTSTDGATWTQASFPDQSNALELTAVTAGGPGFVAFAQDFDTSAAVAYVSADGTSWQRVDDPDFAGQSVFSLGTAASTVVAVSDTGAILTSVDGVGWTFAQDAAAAQVGNGLLDLVGYNGSLWAFVHDGNIPDGDQVIDVWRTDDGVTWSPLGMIEGSQGALEVWASAGPRGVVALADVDRGDRFGWTAWHSIDGVTWQPANNSPADVTDLLATDVGFVASAYYNREGGCVADETQNVGLTWTSANGLTWRQMPEDEAWLGRQILVLGLIGRTLAGVGVDFDELYADVIGESGLAWTAVLPPEASDNAPPPPPTPEPTLPPDCG